MLGSLSSSKGSHRVHQSTRRGLPSLIRTLLDENRPFLGAFPPWKDHKRSGSHNDGPGSGVEMTIGRFNDYYFGIESSVAPVSEAMRCTANHTGPVPRRRSRPKWSRDPRVLDPGPVWGNSHGQSWEMNCTPTVKNDRSDSGTWDACSGSRWTCSCRPRNGLGHEESAPLFTCLRK